MAWGRGQGELEGCWENQRMGSSHGVPLTNSVIFGSRAVSAPLQLLQSCKEVHVLQLVCLFSLGTEHLCTRPHSGYRDTVEDGSAREVLSKGSWRQRPER